MMAANKQKQENSFIEIELREKSCKTSECLIDVDTIKS